MLARGKRTLTHPQGPSFCKRSGILSRGMPATRPTYPCDAEGMEGGGRAFTPGGGRVVDVSGTEHSERKSSLGRVGWD